MHHRLLLLLLLSLKYIVVLSFLLKSQPEDRQQQRLFKMSRQQKAKPLPDIFDVRGAKTLDPYEIVYKPGTAFVKLYLLKYGVQSNGNFCFTGFFGRTGHQILQRVKYVLTLTFSSCYSIFIFVVMDGFGTDE